MLHVVCWRGRCFSLGEGDYYVTSFDNTLKTKIWTCLSFMNCIYRTLNLDSRCRAVSSNTSPMGCWPILDQQWLWTIPRPADSITLIATISLAKFGSGSNNCNQHPQIQSLDNGLQSLAAKGKRDAQTLLKTPNVSLYMIGTC